MKKILEIVLHKSTKKKSINIFHSSQCDSVIDIVNDYETVKQEYEWYLENNYVKEIDGKYVVLIF